MSAVDRVIQEYWADSLDAVSCAFDPALGATIMFNSTEEEAYLTWSTNNSITQLGDLTFKFVTSGVMPTATGNGLNALSSFFIDDTGRVYYPNSKASTSGQKLTTLGLNGDVRGTCEVDGTTVTLDTATSDANAIGGYIYIADDNSATYERVKITNNPTTSTYTIASTINATNGTFELSPVPMRIRYWPISWPREENSVIESYPRFLFRRMLGKSFGIVAYNSSLPSGSEAVVGYYRNYSNTIEYPKLCGLTDNPADNYAYSNADGVSLEPGLDLFVSGGIIEIVAVEVDIEWKDSRKAN